ncbi:hypothetical protein FB567DRAFT_259768 [Paraphoma chrysanthemicola]|uniref:Zn(2)-C6 fungal-type domain-containing protein n=1 Tax=Paraphoma chrysanthemicola TaxID=798071 RepID=A0A8K0VRW5_9PLEO|nr:hypothetical protein FB567DRAFT_259768 [Paraphoma chrysanthemicola]
MEKPRTDRRARASAACDACRVRKVKCVLSNEAKCVMCKELDIECTSERPRKKRGPKNRYVQALRAQLDGEAAPDAPGSEQHDLVMIAPLDVLHRIIDDWFDWIHPVAPALHRGLFLERLNGSQTSDRDHSTTFLLLVASVCAATVASLRRRRHNYGEVTVEACLELAEHHKLWSSSSPITLDRALTLYNFSSAVHHEHGIDSPLSFRLSAESAISIKYLIHHQLDQMTFIEQQLLKRIYWLIFAGQCTGDLHGRRLLVLHHAHESIAGLLPVAATDEELLHGPVSTPIEVQSPDWSYVSGLNELSRLFLIWQSSQAVPVQTLENLQTHLSRAHLTLSELPPELCWAEQSNAPSSFGFNVQKVNLKVTQLHIRSNLLEQMNTLAKEQGFRITPDAIINERHLVVEELLEVLYTMPEEVFDANGYSIVPKIRDIGSALFDELRTGSHGRNLQASITLDKLLAKLETLDIRPMGQSSYL